MLSVGFTAFIIYEDLQQNSTIGKTDAVLDASILPSSLAKPGTVLLKAALGIICLGIDPMYREIKHELDSLPASNNSTGKHLVAVLRGIALGLWDIFNPFLDIFN